ncbi:two-component system nitrogen regulation sensor histidine kinase NtrY [Hephaestia caeni]|uniref:histidine kinase n=1 Tax=Hephaestia caeni TaxID=645617 RepID=A0A397PI71_9SPHN|nr:ATP-binding protein [Hephaestia caeni]RIA45834.1 two-component system nitrogen regulation sensor histidine kinase NtrY [Hephaestia caeni]
MSADAVTIAGGKPRRWQSRLSWPALIEIAVLVAAIVMGVATYFILDDSSTSQKLLSPGVAALLLLGNLLPVAALLVLIGRRVAKRRAARADAAGDGRLHVRLVAIFSLIASVPIVLTVIAASVMFQSVNQFWASSKAETAFNSTIALVEDAQGQFIDRWVAEARAMATDLGDNRNAYPVGTEVGHNYLARQTLYRNLSEAVLFTYEGKDGINVVDVVNPPNEKSFSERVTPQLLKLLSKQQNPAINRTPDTIWIVINVPDAPDLYLYIGTHVNATFINRQHLAASDLIKEYRTLQEHSHALQLKFNAALFAVAVLIIALTVWIALAVADRLVRPVNELVGAALRVSEGDLAVRVPEPRTRDEVGSLGTAFNVMTARLEAQTTALESRRALIEAVMSGVTAGVISIDSDRTVQLVNSSAVALLDSGGGDPVGRPLAALSAELDALLDSDTREAVIQVAAEREPRTLAVKITRDAAGQVLTFDDITQQLLDQRRAAWSDVARRIAHEIKNPLTPIQLAAERLQRRYGKQIEASDRTFQRLTETIVRQVGDLRRMVDEFSSFARMPKPVFREESLVDIGRQALFLHEVAHSNIHFSFEHQGNAVMLVCDRRQIGQALTNIVKNAVEAIEARDDEADGSVVMRLSEDAEHDSVTIEVADDGVGLPIERDRLVEPYMTTRSRGTGLGLAIVKKIVEEHLGTVTFTDREGGGTKVTMTFDRAMLAAIDTGDGSDADDARDRPLPALTRNRTP